MAFELFPDSDTLTKVLGVEYKLLDACLTKPSSVAYSKILPVSLDIQLKPLSTLTTLREVGHPNFIAESI